MNCSVIQKRLMACEQPDFPPLEVRLHLADCSDCRAVQQRVVQIEQHIRELPVPASDARASFVLRFLAGDEAFQAPRRPTPAPHPKENGRLKVAWAFALAAGLVVFALGWWAWPRTGPEIGKEGPAVARRFPDRRAQLEHRLASARTPGERVQRLTALAEELQEEALTSEADAEALGEVARFCVQVVRGHLLKHARTVPEKERKDLLEAVALRLERVESQASRRASHMKGLGAALAAASYRDIADASQETSRSLRLLANGQAAWEDLSPRRLCALA
jgi:hypothetical protein